MGTEPQNETFSTPCTNASTLPNHIPSYSSVLSTTQHRRVRRTSSFFSATLLTSFNFELDLFSVNLPDGIRLEAVNGDMELKFGDDTAEGRPLVIPAGNPFRGVGLGTGGGGIEVLGDGGGGIDVLGEGGGGMDVLGDVGGGIEVSTDSDFPPGTYDGVRACDID